MVEFLSDEGVVGMATTSVAEGASVGDWLGANRSQFSEDVSDSVWVFEFYRVKPISSSFYTHPSSP